MTTSPQLAPKDDSITLKQLFEDPGPIYRRLRAEAPVMRVTAVRRTLLTKAVHTKYVKDTPLLFSSDDPNTPMKRTYQAHTLMRKDGAEHMRERMAMLPALMPKTLNDHWLPIYRRITEDYLDRLPRGETVDLFKLLCGPVASDILAQIVGIPDATHEEMQRWTDLLITSSANFGWDPEPF